jgi:RHS repeat-associated protein
LTSPSHPTQANENYTYDLNGNRINAGNSTGGNNQLLTDGTYNYAYDDEGNRISRTSIGTGAVTEYGWDYRNRLTQVTEKNAVGVVTRSSSYKYDVNNRRITKTIDMDGVGTQVAMTDRYVYDGSQIALVFDGQGNQLQRFLYGTRVDQVLVQENANGDLLWALADYQGSVRDVVDSQGNTLNHLVYDSFGNVTSQTNGAINFRFGYTGRELDAETGLYYYRARYYDAQTGQFIGQDPLSFEAGDSNLYRYVGNNATNLTDPSGLFSFNDAKRWARDRYNDGRKAVSDGINTAGYGIKGTADFYRNKDDVDNAYENIRPVIISRAEESRDRYVDTYNDPNANPLLRFGAGVGGSLTSLAAEDNYDTTKNILEGALLVDGAIQIGRALPGIVKNCKKWIKSPKTLGADIANIFKNKPKTVESDIAKITDKCFVAGTLILTRDGKKPIEDLRTGDWIVSWDEETGEVIERPVTEWFRREAPAIIDIFIGVQKISCTIDHPFWVEKTGWVLASHIKPGTVLRDQEGNALVVDVVRRRNQVAPVYNVEIEGLHTYFVSELEVLSHNACGDLDILSKAGQVVDPKRSNFTKAGGSLTKHGQGARIGNSKFPSVKGNPAKVNGTAQTVLDEILTDPGTTITAGYRGRFGKTVEVNAPDGRGVVFDELGNFLFFKE